MYQHLGAESAALKEPLIRLSDIIITPRISERKSRCYTFEFDQVFRELNQGVEREDETILQGICDAALKFCMAESVGLSLLGYLHDKPVFNWSVAAGRAAIMSGKIYTSRNSPCGTVLDMYSYQVFRHPERHYQWVRENGFVVPEMITVPIYREDMQPFGTFWLMHAEGSYFEREDVRIISMLVTLIHKALRKKGFRNILIFT